MSACLNHVRRIIGSTAVSNGSRQCGIRSTSSLMSSSSNSIIAPAISTSLLSSPLAPSSTTLPIRHFAAAKKAKVGKAKPDDGLTFAARKEAAKQKRRDTYAAHEGRLEKLKTRRDGRPVGQMKEKFRSWYDKERVYHQTLEQKARQQGKPWRIRVAVMVERLPVVTADVEDWEREYFDLRDYIWSWGKEYPEETGFMMAPDKPQDHIIPTDEELLAGLPFTPAPRETEHDATGFNKTIERALKTRVFLAVKSDAEGNKNGPRWTLPSAIAQTDETLLQTAERAVTECAGKDLAVWCPSNAPMNVNFRVYNKNLPEDFRKDYIGEKIFYYRVQHESGDVNDKAMMKAEDWGWLTKEEIVENVTGERGEHQAKFYHYML